MATAKVVAEDGNPCGFKKKERKRNYYRYYDSPDGCDVHRKVMAATRYGIVTGLFAGTYDVLMYSHVVGFGPILTRYARHVLPLGLMGATFAVVANMTQQARDADDQLNYFLGGLACGPLVALYTRSYHGLVAGGLFLGAAGVIKKEAVDRKISLFPMIPDHMNTVDDWRRDWTLVADPRDSLINTCAQDREKDEEREKATKKQTQKKEEEKCEKRSDRDSKCK